MDTIILPEDQAEYASISKRTLLNGYTKLQYEVTFFYLLLLKFTFSCFTFISFQENVI